MHNIMEMKYKPVGDMLLKNHSNLIIALTISDTLENDIFIPTIVYI